MKSIMCGCGLLVALAQGVVATSAHAQDDTRAGAIAAAQAEKAQRLAPRVPSKAERIAEQVQNRLFSTPNGFYPWLDSVYGGGGFTLGAGYRRFYGDRTYWDARGLFSAKAYKLAEFATDSLDLAQGRVDLHAAAGWRDATQVSFFGVGGDTAAEDKSNFRMKQAYVGGVARSTGPARTVLDLGFYYEDYSLQSGEGSSPSIENVHTADTAPGLGANPAYLHLIWTGGIDSRPSPGYARRGGLYALTYDGYFDVDGLYTFDRLQAEVVQHVPILRENWVVSLHGVARTTLDDNDTVPYFLLPSLGSGSTLRAYQSWRFRDRHSLLLSGEWRWTPSRMFLDMALFYDAGKVASRREDLNLNGLKHDVGVGVRFHGPIATPLRVDVAHGSEGMNIVFSGAAAF
jgi:hypothetical protein